MGLHAMDPQRWAHIERLYHEALVLHPNERVSFLAAACGGDPELKQQVAILLDQAATIDGVLATPRSIRLAASSAWTASWKEAPAEKAVACASAPP
jgi:hypothetical protein